MDRRFGCRDSWVYIDFAADSESVSLAVGCAEEADTAAVVDAMLTNAIRTFFARVQNFFTRIVRQSNIFK